MALQEIVQAYQLPKMELKTEAFDFNEFLAREEALDTLSDYNDLIKAIQADDKTLVDMLLEKDVSVVNPDLQPHDSPLHLAVERDSWVSIVKLLVDRGAEVSLKNKKGDTALHRAFLSPSDDTEKYINSMLLYYLSKEGNKNLVNAHGISFLHIASAKAKLPYVKDLLNVTGVDVNGQVLPDSESYYAGFTALHFAVEYNRVDVAASLLNRNASIYIQDVEGRTPLHLALYLQNSGIIDLLLSHDKDYHNIVDNRGISHFMAACMCSIRYHSKHFLNVAMTYYNISPEELVNTRVDCDGEMFEGYSPLHFAVQWNRLVTVHMLLSSGADCCALTSDNVTPHTLADNLPLREVGNVLTDYCELYQAQFSVQIQEPLGDSEFQAIPEEYLRLPEVKTSIDIESSYPTHTWLAARL